MVECTGLENQRGGNLSVSSNLTPSASKILFPFMSGNFSKSQHFIRIISVSEPISRVRTVGALDDCFMVRQVIPFTKVP